MKIDILKFKLEEEQDISLANKTALELSGYTGLETGEQVRFAEAVTQVSKSYLEQNTKGIVSFQITRDADKCFLKAIITPAETAGFKPVLSGNYGFLKNEEKNPSAMQGLARHFSISTAETIGNGIVLGQEIGEDNLVISKPVLRKWKERLLGGKAAAAPKDQGTIITDKDRIREMAGLLKQKEKELKASLSEIKHLNASLKAANKKLEIPQGPGSKESSMRAKELSRANEELHRSNQELHRSNKDLEQFAYAVSHDLQEPLRKILTFGERLIQKYSGKLGTEGEDYIKRMEDATIRMQLLIDDMLAFSRVSRNHDPFRDTDLNVIIHEILNDMEISISQKKASFSIDDLPVINAIPGQMRQLFQNLISNALKFSAESKHPHISISCDKPLKGICNIYVKDNGIGFRPEYASQIFEIFQRLHTRDKYKGTGIGLSICKKIVENHRGVITARSEPWEGATFIISLPLKASGRRKKEGSKL
jgi:signal transduction histidine kinase